MNREIIKIRMYLAFLFIIEFFPNILFQKLFVVCFALEKGHQSPNGTAEPNIEYFIAAPHISYYYIQNNEEYGARPTMAIQAANGRKEEI